MCVTLCGLLGKKVNLQKRGVIKMFTLPNMYTWQGTRVWRQSKKVAFAPSWREQAGFSKRDYLPHPSFSLFTCWDRYAREGPKDLARTKSRVQAQEDVVGPLCSLSIYDTDAPLRLHTARAIQPLYFTPICARGAFIGSEEISFDTKRTHAARFTVSEESLAPANAPGRAYYGPITTRLLSCDCGFIPC